MPILAFSSSMAAIRFSSFSSSVLAAHASDSRRPRHTAPGCGDGRTGRRCPSLRGTSAALKRRTSSIIRALATPWGRWWNAPSLCAMEWHTPRKALAKAIPAMVGGVCHLLAGFGILRAVFIGSGAGTQKSASGSAAPDRRCSRWPSWRRRLPGRGSRRRCRRPQVRPLGAFIIMSASTMAIFGSSS